MLRNGITNSQKAVDATYKAHANLKRGMGVVKSLAGGVKTTAFPEAKTDVGVFLVDRDNLPTGIEGAYSDRPDTAFDDIKAGEYIKLVPYVQGEMFYTDQYKGAIEAGTKVQVDTDGKWVNADDSKYVCRGTTVEANVTYIVVEHIA